MSTLETGQGLVADDWSGDMGRNWLANLPRFEGMIAPMGAALVKHAAYMPGEHVVDIGCGGGGTTMTIARIVSPGGSATGFDISHDLIVSCGVRASQGTQSSIFFVCGDAATTIPTNAPFDRLFSRFGCMFFADAVAGYTNLRKMLKKGGRIDLAVWGPPDRNPWMQTVANVVARHIPDSADAPPPAPHAPGPFAFADPEYMRDVLTKSGFGEIEITPCEAMLAVGGSGATPLEGAEFIMSAMHFAQQIDDADRAKVVAELAAALEPHHQPKKGNMLKGMAWLVSAKAQ